MRKDLRTSLLVSYNSFVKRLTDLQVLEVSFVLMSHSMYGEKGTWCMQYVQNINNVMSLRYN